ncbi:MAG: AAA family ATPase, partial [Oligoflexia bacterium]|nr:AAA family ATPase [Oligoflexia bacterium]
MFLKKAEALHFRNYNHFSLDFDSSINVFVGENGQGKSSFLEALYCALR